MSKPTIKKSELIDLITVKGYTRKQLASHYQISVGEMDKYIKQAGLKSKRAAKMSYQVVDDTMEVSQPNNQETLITTVA